MADDESRTGIRYATPETIAFVERHHSPLDAAARHTFDASKAHGLPPIQISPSEGATLTLLMRMIQARKVVEVGTLAGYSALCLARGISQYGKLWTLELEPSNARIAQGNLELAGLGDRVEVRVGAALQTLNTIISEGPFDAVFLDADKGNYPAYARWAFEHLRPGGLLLADNSYFFGQLMSDQPEAVNMREFHAFVAAHFDSACVPTPDGLVLGIKR